MSLCKALVFKVISPAGEMSETEPTCVTEDLEPRYKVHIHRVWDLPRLQTSICLGTSNILHPTLQGTGNGRQATFQGIFPPLLIFILRNARVSFYHYHYICMLPSPWPKSHSRRITITISFRIYPRNNPVRYD